jgi:diaminohydroxyphosphoribosylaminopyrimidine deaminase/5-amino-6-(5-phosphoribosylamino)uracil reductase
VLTQGSEIVGEGFHVYSERAHAEVVALRQAGERARGATAYVTLEPCSHTGRTGPCADALIEAGVARVVCAMTDPNPQVSGSGLARLNAAGIPASIDSRYTAEAELLNEPFVHAMRTGLPLVTLKCAVTLDGKIAAPEDNTGWITSEQARIHVQRVRHLHDAVVTGIGTVLADDPLLTDRSGLERSRPFLRVVLDSQLRTPLTSRLVESADGDLLIVCNSVAPLARRLALESRGVRVEALAGPLGRTSIPELVRLLGRETYRSVMIEGGSKINWAALESNAVDKVFLYYAPKILGGLESLPMAGGIGRRSRSDAIRLRNLRLHPISTDEFAVEAYIRKED